MTDPYAWRVRFSTSDPRGFMSDHALIGIARTTRDGYEVIDGSGVVHRFDHGEQAPDDALIRIPLDAVVALRDALTAETKGAPNEATITELRAALAVEQARTDRTLAALLRSAPAVPVTQEDPHG